MRWRSLIWLTPALLLLAIPWWFGRVPPLHYRDDPQIALASPPHLRSHSASPLHLTTAANPAFPYRLSNTTNGLVTLLTNRHAILLENAIVDTEAPLNLRIPPALRSTGDPGAYIAQCRGPLDLSFRDHLTQLGASIVNYIPNHAYLVRAGRHNGPAF